MVPSEWIRVFHIVGRACVLESGEEIELTVDSDGVLLEGGKLEVLKKEISNANVQSLVRTGRSGVPLYFRRVWCESDMNPGNTPARFVSRGNRV